jgi:hypothetical protein
MEGPIKQTFRPKLRSHQLRYTIRLAAFAGWGLILMSAFFFLGFVVSASEGDDTYEAILMLGASVSAFFSAVAVAWFAGLGGCMENVEARLAQIQDLLESQRQPHEG